MAMVDRTRELERLAPDERPGIGWDGARAKEMLERSE